MTEDDNRSASNLLLLCVEHAAEVDLPHRVAEYTVDVLRAWKQAQIEAYDQAVRSAGTGAVGWDLSQTEVEQVQHYLTDNSMSFRADTMIFGGLGGAAVGAAGGGGAAIGSGALGGPGGPASQIILDGTFGAAPGAGGGGGASMAPDAMSASPISIPEGLQGHGFSAGTDGEDGGDTVLRIGDQEIRAVGGAGGLAGTGERSQTDSLRISSIVLARYAEWSDTATVVGGGIVWYAVLNLPARLVVTAFMIFEAGGVDTGEYTVAVEVHNPAGERRGRVRFPLTVERVGEVVRISRGCDVPVDVDSFGVWTVVVSSSGADPVTHSFIVKRYGEG